MAHDSSDVDRIRNSDNEPDSRHRPGASGGRGGNGDSHASGQHNGRRGQIQSIATKKSYGASETAASDPIPSHLSSEHQRDTPTPPIDVPFSDSLGRRHLIDYGTQVVQESDHLQGIRGSKDTKMLYGEAELAITQSSSASPPQNGRNAGYEQPKLQLRTRSHSRPVLADVAKDASSEFANPGYATRKERSVAMQVPSLATIVPGEALGSVPSLSESEKGSSPLLEEIPTPSCKLPGIFDTPTTLSPSQSPASASSSWYGRKHGRTRRTTSARRTSRRSDATPVSASPAAEFLRQYSSSAMPRVPSPDSEGVEVGEYVLGREIGSGGFSLVREAFSSTSASSSPTFAVKILRRQVRCKSEAENEALQIQFEHELEVWRPLNHANILRLHQSIATPFATFAFMPLVAGGTLWDAVKATNGNGLDMKLTRRYAAQVAQALRYLHQDMHLAHRDVKLENCLLVISSNQWAPSSDSLPHVLLADFGLAEHIPSISPTMSGYESSPVSSLNDQLPAETGLAGSLPYTAPEMLNAKKTPTLSPKVDIWAYGVLLFALVTGRMPFQHSFTPKLVELIKSGRFDRDLLEICISKAHRPELQTAGELVEDNDGQRTSIFRNESWAASALTIVPTEGVPIDGDSLKQVLDGCLNTKPLERWDIAQLMNVNWLVDEVEIDPEDVLEITSR